MPIVASTAYSHIIITTSKVSHLEEELSNTSVYTPGCLVTKRPFTVEPCVEATLLVGIKTRC